MLKYLKVFTAPIVRFLIIGFYLSSIGCSSLYEYVPPSIVSFGESKVAVAHKNKWRFGKNYNVASKAGILQKAEAACFAANETKAIFHSKHCDDRFNKKNCTTERFLFVCEVDQLKKNEFERERNAVIRYSRAKEI
tara:strand:+ start:63 stop:470 length:408 start_codon:yes stop_codon:yes gene_type:complete